MTRARTGFTAAVAALVLGIGVGPAGAAPNSDPTIEIDASAIVQVVEHEGATYPVVADPNTCGIATCTYYFGKRATRDIASAKNAVAGCSLLANIGPAGPGCAIAWAAVSIQADRAQARGMCLKIKYTKSLPPVWWPDIYRGSYCR